METKKKWTWTDEYTIRSYDVDTESKASLMTFAKYLQESAYNHASHLELGHEQLMERNLFWVLSRLLIRVESYPRWGERLTLTTWPSGVDRLFACRDFLVRDSGGAVMFTSTSSWLVLDSEKRRPQRPFDELGQSADYPRERVIDRRPAKLEKLSEPRQSPSFPVRYSDLDMYDHVNNVKYIQWILDDFPPEMNRKFDVKEFEINFLAEAKMGDDIVIQTQETGTAEYIHSIKRKTDNKDLCLVRTAWEK
jgi:medium-chain acyl-[acyl-carrier-protein] hydrolase